MHGSKLIGRGNPRRGVSGIPYSCPYLPIGQGFLIHNSNISPLGDPLSKSVVHDDFNACLEGIILYRSDIEGFDSILIKKHAAVPSKGVAASGSCKKQETKKKPHESTILTNLSTFAKTEARMDSLHQVLKKILSSNPVLGKGMEEARLLELWPEGVGESIAKHSKAVQIKGTILFVSVEKPVWRQELHSNKALVLEKLNRCLRERLGAPRSGTLWISDIFFLGPQGASSSTGPKKGKWSQKK